MWSGVGTVPQGRTLGSPRPALGPGRPGPWPPRLPGSRASPSAPVQGHSCPGGTATTGCPACPVLGRTQPTAGSWRALGRAPLGGAREENGGWAAGALARGWRPQPRGWGVGGGGWSGGGGAGWGGVGWGGVGGEPPGMGGGGRARWLSGAGEPGPRAQQGAAPPAQWTRSPAAHPGSRGRVRPGPKPAGRCSLCPPLDGPPRGPCHHSSPPPRSAPGSREGAPRGKPRRSKQDEATGGRLRPGRARFPPFPGLLAGAPGRKPTQGLGGSPRGSRGEGAEAGRGRLPPPPPGLPGPGRHRPLGSSEPWGATEDRTQGEQHPTPAEKDLASGGPAARAPGPGRVGCVSGRPHQLALPASVWDQTTSVHGAVTESFGGQRVTGLSPKHANAGEARPGRLCPCPPRPPWTWRRRRRRRRRPDTSRVVSWGKTDLLRLRAQARPSTSRLRVRKDGADQGRPTACLAGTEGFAGVSRTQEGRDAGPGRARGSEPTAEVPPAESRREAQGLRGWAWEAAGGVGPGGNRLWAEVVPASHASRGTWTLPASHPPCPWIPVGRQGPRALGDPRGPARGLKAVHREGSPGRWAGAGVRVCVCAGVCLCVCVRVCVRVCEVLGQPCVGQALSAPFAHRPRLISCLCLGLSVSFSPSVQGQAGWGWGWGWGVERVVRKRQGTHWRRKMISGRGGDDV